MKGDRLMYYDDTFELDNLLYGEVEGYRKDREEKWSNSDIESKLLYERSESFAFHIYKCCKKLYSLETIDEELSSLQYELGKLYSYGKGNLKNEYSKKMKEIANSGKDRNIIVQEIMNCWNEYFDNIPFHPNEKESPLRLVWERLCIEYAGDLTSSVCTLAERTIKIYELILPIKPARATVSYLFRLARCYIWGFDPECTILCRSVIDSAFLDRVSDEMCESHLGPPRHWGTTFTLKDRITVAHKKGLLDDKMREIAEDIRSIGNDVVHLDPNIAKDSFSAIKNTIAVLECLYGN